MHNIEPYYNWRDRYIASDDKYSPFFDRTYSEHEFSNNVYGYYIHPQWDDFGSSTLYLKVLYTDYDKEFAIIELIGEWNDCLHNDIMFLKREVIDPMIRRGINQFILLGENVLNFHSSDDCYYEEWLDDIKDEGGWIAGINFREHVLDEMRNTNLHYYINMGPNLDSLLWRKLKPDAVYTIVEGLIMKALA